MEKLSRVSKYEDLRKQIEDDTIGADALPEEKLQDYAQRLNEIDPSIFKKVPLTEEPYTPERERKTSAYEEESMDSTIGGFRNEYLDDFINEVREYNIKKGNREYENTQIDILNQLNTVSRGRRSDYVKNIEDEPEVKMVGASNSFSKEEITAQLHNFILESESAVEEEPAQVEEEPRASVVYQAPVYEEEVVVQPKPQPIVQPKPQVQPQEQAHSQTEQGLPNIKPARVDLVTTEISPMGLRNNDPEDYLNKTIQMQANTLGLKKQDIEKKRPFAERKAKPSVVPTKEVQEEVEREKQLQQKLVEETQQLRVQLNEYEDDLNDLSEGVEKTNKMLNIILGCLILALLVIVGIIVFWIVQAGGLV